MKKWLMCSLMLASALVSVQVAATEYLGRAGTVQSGSASSSVVRSRAELDIYLANSPGNPIQKLGAVRMKSFLDSLTFTHKGLGSYSSAALADMDTNQGNQVLAIFGLDERTGATRVRRELSSSSMSGIRFIRPPSPRQGKMCVFSPGGRKGRCVNGPGYRCSHLCG